MLTIKIFTFCVLTSPLIFNNNSSLKNFELKANSQQEDTTFILTRNHRDIATNEYTSNILRIWRTDSLARKDLYKTLLENKDSFYDFDTELLTMALGEPDYSEFGYKYENFYEIDSSGTPKYYGCWLEFQFNKEGRVNNLSSRCH